MPADSKTWYRLFTLPLDRARDKISPTAFHTGSCPILLNMTRFEFHLVTTDASSVHSLVQGSVEEHDSSTDLLQHLFCKWHFLYSVLQNQLRTMCYSGSLMAAPTFTCDSDRPAFSFSSKLLLSDANKSSYCSSLVTKSLSSSLSP